MKRIRVFSSVAQMEQAFEGKPIRVLRIGDLKICMAKYESKYFAFEALCPHQRQPLAEGTFNSFGEVICPLHFYRFNMTTGREAGQLCRDLQTYKLEQTDSGVFVYLG